VDPALLARSHNRLMGARRGETSSDNNIQRRRWLLVDCDPERPSGVSATGSEKAHADARCLAIRETLRSAGWPEPVRADSGNGYHLLYRVELPVDSDLPKRCLDALALRFDDAAVKIDRTVFNPSRIVKLYGTLTQKGDHCPDLGRVHRMAKLLDIPTVIEPVPVPLLEALAGQASHVIQNTWLYEQARLKARLLESLVSVGQTINSALNVDEALQVITREACQLMRAKVCSLLLLDDSREWLDLRASHGASPEYVNKPRLSLGESLVGMVVRRKKPVQVEDVRNSALYQNVEVAQREGLVSLLSVPLLYRQQAIGALSIYTERPHSFSNEEIRILSALAELSAVAIEKARLYERIMTMEEELRQSERLSALGLLAAEVAHEIRNPLTVMKMLFHSLDLRYPETDPRARDASLMAEKMDHLNKTVERILDFARSVEPQWAPVNLNELIGDLGLLIRHKLKNQSIQLVPKLAADLPIIQADATQLEQAFLNLALNAVEAMPTGGKLSITTRALPRRGPTPTHVVVEFKDTGGGFSAAARQRVFGSLLATTKRTGTGLGLAIVNRVVETHLGKLRIRSREGHGAAFCVILPLSRVV